MRTLPLSSIVTPLPRAVRDLAAETGKQVELVVVGAETELDRAILEGLSEPLVHLLRNAVGHGIEPPEERERAGKPARGRLELRAEQRGSIVEVTVSDDGRGISEETLAEARRSGSLTAVLTQPGFSTAGAVSGLAGRGVGLDAVRDQAEAFGGSIEVRSEPGHGMQVILRLPLALALIEVLLVERAGNVYGFPLASVEEAVSLGATLSLAGQPAIELREPLDRARRPRGADGRRRRRPRCRARPSSCSPPRGGASRSSATPCSARRRSWSSRSGRCSRRCRCTWAPRSSATAGSPCSSTRPCSMRASGPAARRGGGRPPPSRARPRCSSSRTR